MNIDLKINDDTMKHPELGDVPVVTMDIKGAEEVDPLAEPTPAMWTTACIYSLHVSGKLMELTRQFMLSKRAEAAGQPEASGDGVTGD